MSYTDHISASVLVVPWFCYITSFPVRLCLFNRFIEENTLYTHAYVLKNYRVHERVPLRDNKRLSLPIPMINIMIFDIGMALCKPSCITLIFVLKL